MLNISHQFEKNALSINQKEGLLLVEMIGSKSIKNNKRMKLNVSIAIDISTSMRDSLQSNNNYIVNPFMNNNPLPVIGMVQNMGMNQHPILGGVRGVNNHFGGEFPSQAIKSKLDQAKNAAIQAVQQMKKGDRVSIVIFDDKVDILVPSIEINKKTIVDIVSKINQLQTRGSTNLHGGWLTAATEVAKHLGSDTLNRVILLSDGQTNSGLRDEKAIGADVARLYEKHISTTTFGIGEGFNEDLLQLMSNSGGGNFYYIEKDNQINDFFTEEFSGMENISAHNIKVKINLSKHCTLKQQLNNYTKNGEVYSLPSITTSQKLAMLFSLEYHNLKTKKDLNLGTIEIEYTTQNGDSIKQEISLSIPVVSDADYEKQSFNDEVKVKEVLLTIAQNKINIMSAIDSGNMNEARSMLSGSMAYASSSMCLDERVLSESNTLNATMMSMDNVSANTLRKNISNQSYQMRNDKKS